MPDVSRVGTKGLIGGWVPIRMPTADNLCATLRMPDYRDYAVSINLRPEPYPVQDTLLVLESVLRDVIKLNLHDFTSASSDRMRRLSNLLVRCLKQRIASGSERS